LAFSLNGHAFHASCEHRVRGALAPGTALDGDTDSEVLFALVRDRITAGAGPADAVAAVHSVIAPGADVYVNLLLVTAERIVATTWQHTLYVRSGSGATTVSSEPLDDAGWTRVPDASLLVADADAVVITPLGAT
jgi:glutamine amidotransferase